MTSKNWRGALAGLFAALAIAVLLSVSLKTSSADAVVPNHAASQGRTLAPAGAPVLDATARQPAVGALAVDFVRSPDREGADGAGRFLVAVHSGYGIQFNAATNKAQQSLAVIDLNARPGDSATPYWMRRTSEQTPPDARPAFLCAPSVSSVPLW